MTERTSLDQIFIETMEQVRGMKAELMAVYHNPRKPETLPHVRAGFAQVRKSRRFFIAKYRELKAEEATMAEDDPRRQ